MLPNSGLLCYCGRHFAVDAIVLHLPMEQQDQEQLLDELVARSQAGDQEAFGRLYDILITPVFRYVYYRAQKNDVEDLVEIVFLKVWQYIQRYQKRDVSFKAWVFRIAHNLVVDYYRTHRTVSELDVRLHDTSKEADPVHFAELSLNNDLLLSALGQLKKNYREVLVLKFINDLDNDEIAKVIGRREGAVRVLQFRALSALRKVLEEMGHHEL